MNLGPLTTTFTPPSSCSTPYFNHESIVLQAWYCDPSDGYLSADRDCFPPFAPTATASERFYGVGYYSPASVCPVGYAVACSSTGGVSSATGGFSFQFPPEAGETALGCCPTGYGCTLVARSIPEVTLIQLCTSMVTSGTFLEYGKCTQGHKPTLSVQQVPYVIHGHTVAAMTKHNPLIQLKYRASSPTATTPPAPGRTSNSAPLTSPPSRATAASSPTTSSASSSSGGLSVGAEAGIGVGIGILVIAIIALLVFFLFRRRRRNQARSPSQSQGPLTNVESQYVADISESKMAWMPGAEAELGTGSASDSSRSELPVASRSKEYLHANERVELGSSTPTMTPVELPTSKSVPALEMVTENARRAPFVQKWRFSELKDIKDKGHDGES